MLHKLRRRTGEERGFTLIELLVVILIIGILAAIAIPTFINQKGKADDAQAKSLARTTQTAMETYATDHDGSYSGATTTTINQLEPSINITSSPSKAYLSSVSTPSANSYAVTVNAPQSGDTFTITNSAGQITRSCTGSGGGCVSNTW